MCYLFVLLVVTSCFFLSCSQPPDDCKSNSDCAEWGRCMHGRCIPKSPYLDAGDIGDVGPDTSVQSNFVRICHNSDEVPEDARVVKVTGREMRVLLEKSDFQQNGSLMCEDFLLPVARGVWVYRLAPKLDMSANMPGPVLLIRGNHPCSTLYKENLKGYPICD